ncbi:hypothetical protein BGX24_005677, partial [Mortierella sp. AD032]
MPPRARTRSYAAVVAQGPLSSSTKQKQNIVAPKKGQRGSPITDAYPTTKPTKTKRPTTRSQITNPPTATVKPPTVKPPNIRFSTTKSPATKSPATKSPATKSPATRSATTKSPATNLAKDSKAPVMSKHQSKTPNINDPNSSKAVTKRNTSAKKPTTRKRSTPAKKKVQRYPGPNGSTVRRLSMHQKEQNIMHSTIPPGMTEEQYKDAIRAAANKTADVEEWTPEPSPKEAGQEDWTPERAKAAMARSEALDRQDDQYQDEHEAMVTVTLATSAEAQQDSSVMISLQDELNALGSMVEEDETGMDLDIFSGLIPDKYGRINITVPLTLGTVDNYRKACIYLWKLQSQRIALCLNPAPNPRSDGSLDAAISDYGVRLVYDRATTGTTRNTLCETRDTYD